MCFMIYVLEDNSDMVLLEQEQPNLVLFLLIKKVLNSPYYKHESFNPYKL